MGSHAAARLPLPYLRRHRRCRLLCRRLLLELPPHGGADRPRRRTPGRAAVHRRALHLLGRGAPLDGPSGQDLQLPWKRSRRAACTSPIRAVARLRQGRPAPAAAGWRGRSAKADRLLHRRAARSAPLASLWARRTSRVEEAPSMSVASGLLSSASLKRAVTACRPTGKLSTMSNQAPPPSAMYLYQPSRIA